MVVVLVRWFVLVLSCLVLSSLVYGVCVCVSFFLMVAFCLGCFGGLLSCLVLSVSFFFIGCLLSWLFWWSFVLLGYLYLGCLLSWLSFVLVDLCLFDLCLGCLVLSYLIS